MSDKERQKEERSSDEIVEETMKEIMESIADSEDEETPKASESEETAESKEEEESEEETENAFVADFIGESNILPAIMVEDKLVKILGVNFPCVDTGFGKNKPVDAVIRPEDIDLVKPEEGILEGIVTHLIFKGVHYEMEVTANNFEWLVHSTDMVPVGTPVGIKVDPFDIQIMKKPESKDEEAVIIEE